MATTENALMKGVRNESIPLLGVDVGAEARGLLLETTFCQRYRNTSERNIEAIYTFPLPDQAVLLDLEVVLGGRTLKGRVAQRKEAEEKYEAAIDDGNSAVLLEKSAAGIYTLSLGNLRAGEDASVRVRYAELLSFRQGSVRIGIPTVIAPRYGDAIGAGIAPHAVPEASLLADYPFECKVVLDSQLSRGRVTCPTHVAKFADLDGCREVTFAGRLDRDLVVVIDGLEGVSMSAVAPDKDGFVALASFIPAVSSNVAPKPLRLKVLIDCSGSMGGTSIAQAKRGLARLLQSLDAADVVTLSRFGNAVDHLGGAFSEASRRNVAAMQAWAESLDANMGGTEMQRALEAVFALGGPDARNADVFLVTDGEVWNVEKVVESARRSEQRVFVVGVGAAPAQSLVSNLAQSTGGAAEFVTPGESIDEAIMRMFARLRSPRATNLSVVWPSTPEWQVQLPSTLFGGETVHALARFETRPVGDVRLAWHDGASRSATAVLAGGNKTEADTLARVAASRHLSSLPKDLRATFAENYQLVSEYTSMVLVLERGAEEKSPDLPDTIRVPTMLAAGWGAVGIQQLDAPAVTRSRHDTEHASLGVPLPSVPRDLLFEMDESYSISPPQKPRSLFDRVRSRVLGDVSDLPTTLAEIERFLNDDLRDLVEELLDSGLDEEVVVAWLVVELSRRCPDTGFSRKAIREARRVVKTMKLLPSLTRIEQAFATAEPARPY